MKLTDKVAIVTGGSSGIGKAICELYAKEGAKVVVSDINEEAGQKVAEAVGGIFVKTDCSNAKEVEAAVDAAVREYGKIDIMVNNAGVGTLGGALDTTDDTWDKTIGVNLSGVFYGIRTAANKMKEAGAEGSIINMTSILGTVGFPGAISYCAAKGGVTNMTRAAAVDLAPHKIRVNAIAPAFIETAMTEGVLGDEGFQAMVKANTPLGYVGKPEDIANAALFLATTDSSYVTGNILHVDGGWTCH